MSVIRGTVVKATPYLLSVGGVIPIHLPADTIAQTLLVEPAGSTRGTSDLVARSAAPVSVGDYVIDAADYGVIPSILRAGNSVWAEEGGYEDFISSEAFTEEVTYVRAAKVVEESPPEHFFDDHDLAAIASFEK